MSQSTPVQATARQLLDLLHRPPGEGAQGPAYCYIWQKVRGQQAGRTLWYEVGEEFPPFQESADLYFSVHPCKGIPTHNQRGKPAPPYRVRGKIEDIASVAAIFAEFDVHADAAPPAPGLPTAGETSKADLLDYILALDPAPSVVVDSGGGFHAYWLLSAPVKASRLAIELQANWVRWLAAPPSAPSNPSRPYLADPASKDLARVLRLPGTFNHKYDPPRPVQIVHWRPDLTYSTSELRASLPLNRPGSGSGSGSGQIFSISFNHPAATTHPTTGASTADLQIVTVADVRQYMTRILRQELRRVRTASEGDRNNALNQAAFALGRYVDAAGLNAEALASRLLDAALSVKLPRREAAQTIQAALDAGMEEMPPLVFRTPEDIIEDAAQVDSPQALIALRREFARVLSTADTTARDTWAEAAKEAGLGGKTILQQAIKDSRPTDADVRDLVLEQHPNLVYHPALEWMHYDQGAWEPTPDHTVKRWIMNSLDEVDRPSLTSSRVESVANLLFWSTCRELENWDQRDIVVCTNGTIDLDPTRPLKLRPHRRDDYSTHRVEYALPKGHFAQQCPAFLKVVSRLPEPEVQFLQEYIGYCLTRDTRHDVMVWIVGRPGSGKSTLIRGILTALGGHATMVSLRELARSRFALNNIVGKTLIYGTDVGTDFLSNTDVLNALVSGDPIRVEAKYANAFEILPTAKVLWAMTKKPALSDPDDGLFRRVQLITMPPLPSDQADPNIRVQVEQEGPGILAWAIQGLLRLRQRGHFLIPKSVRAHTTAYRDDMDKTQHFASDCLQVIPPDQRANAPVVNSPADASAGAIAAAARPAPGEPVRAAAVYAAYKAWCKISGYNALGRNKFYEELRRLDVDLGSRSSGQAHLVCFSHQLLPRSEWDLEAIQFEITDSESGKTVKGVA